jgi:ferredoxin
MDSAHIYCFSGTGNTLLVARALADELGKVGIPAKISPMERADPKALDLGGAVGIAFPVAIFTTYPVVWSFVRSMPRGEGTEVFMVDTLGGLSAGIMAPMKRILEEKGYRAVGIRQIRMPLNLIHHKEDAKARLIGRGLGEARGYARDLAGGRASWGSLGYLSDLSKLLLSNRLVWWLARQYPKMRVAEDNCVRCGTCARICQAGNIAMEDKPRHGGNCQVCMRCYAYCPREAILYSDIFKRYRAVDAADFLGK